MPVTYTNEKLDTMKWIRRLRKRLGLTQKALGHKLGVAAGNVSAWECGWCMPHRATMRKLVKLADKLAKEEAKANKR